MSSNLVKARSSIIFILALLVAFSLVYWIERKSGEAIAGATSPAGAVPAIALSPDIPGTPAARALTPREAEWARIAWRYFENNTDPRTGLAGSVDGFKAATLWDTASYLLALISARQLDILPEADFDRRMSAALGALADLPLFDKTLPNKSYNIASLAMVDYENRESAGGIGWSAIDLGRLLAPLHLIVWRYPDHAEAARRVLLRWDLSRAVKAGQLVGMQAGADNGGLRQEGRLGYEQYAARGFALLGLPVDRANDYREHLRLTDVYGVALPHDDRDAAGIGGHNYVLSEPYVLEGLEYGWNFHAREFAWRVYRAQEERFRRTGVLTAVSEDHLDREPYFAYNTVFSNGRAWQALSPNGQDATALRWLSVKTALGWHALYRTDYTAKLVEAVTPLHDEKKGWFAGRYEESGQPNRAITANTNAVVLESLAFIARGKPLNSH